MYVVVRLSLSASGIIFQKYKTKALFFFVQSTIDTKKTFNNLFPPPQSIVLHLIKDDLLYSTVYTIHRLYNIQ